MYGILKEPVEFEWDKGNINKNLFKHNVTDQESEEIFTNTPLVDEDRDHSQNERRFKALGETKKKRLLFVSFTVRNNKLRVISARDMNKKERQIYAKT